jgi:hypothetical protein
MSIKCVLAYIIKIAAWAVPAGIHAGFSLPNHLDLYLTSNGQWAPTLEIAEHLFLSEPAPEEFKVKGSLLALFVPGKWVLDNGNPNTYSDYRVFWDRSGYWNADEIEPPVKVAVGNLPDYF